MQIPQRAKTTYIRRRQKDVGDCYTAILNNDFSFLERIGHQIRGNAHTFGYEALAKIGALLESSAQRKNKESAALQIHELKKFLSQVIIN
jgi:HPt (histidine-containing phosphotransfer) domain-containing protein